MYQTAFQDYSNPLRFAYGASISNAIVIISIVLILISNTVSKQFKSGEDG
jgi:raffinose/stachyose/melibiose transport system permease protein